MEINNRKKRIFFKNKVSTILITLCFRKVVDPQSCKKPGGSTTTILESHSLKNLIKSMVSES